MGTGFKGTFVISWPQTQIDGQAHAPVTELRIGATWSWNGDLVRVDGPGELLQLGQASGSEELRQRAARVVRSFVGAAVTGRVRSTGLVDIADEPLLPDDYFVVTDGTRSFTVTLIDVGPEARPLMMFVDDMPPKGRDLWVVHCSHEGAGGGADGSGGVICFTQGTMIETPDGPQAVETLGVGDRVSTKDSGAQEIEWVGARRMSGARLFAMPEHRPVRFLTGALGIDRPDRELVVSPEHRMLVQGAAAQALFNSDEVLVRAKDLINDHSIRVDSQMKEVRYYHLLLPRHQIVWANGVETESFHPANTALSSLGDDDRARLLEMRPEFERTPERYGATARRNLCASEAAILLHEAA